MFKRSISYLSLNRRGMDFGIHSFPLLLLSSHQLCVVGYAERLRLSQGHSVCFMELLGPSSQSTGTPHHSLPFKLAAGLATNSCATPNPACHFAFQLSEKQRLFIMLLTFHQQFLLYATMNTAAILSTTLSSFQVHLEDHTQISSVCVTFHLGC